MSLLIASIIGIQALTSGLVYAQMRALPTNHYMATNVKLSMPDSSTAENTLPSISGPAGVPLIFKTFDQITCNTGNYEIIFRIVKADNNILITGTKPIPFNSPNHGYVYTQPVVWQVLFPEVGWYRYDVVVNNEVIASYFFTVAFKL